MADPARVTKTGAYSVHGDGPPRVTKTGAYVVEGSATSRRVTKAGAYVVEAEPVGVGDPPVLRVGGIDETSADLSVDPLAEYLEIIYDTWQGTTLIDRTVLTGPTRFVHPLGGLDPDTDYSSRARVLREEGHSPWSAWVDFTTTVPGQDPFRNCPPAILGHLQNPDGNPPNFPGRGWYVPYPGQPLRGVVTCVLRHNSPAWLWNISLSDDAGETYTTIVENLEGDGEFDGDHLELYSFELDTTQLADGMNYRLRASSAIPGDDEVYESLTFAIDNAEQVYGWRHSAEPLEGRFGKMWAQQGSSRIFDVPDDTIWVRGRDGGIGGLANHAWALYADRQIPQCEGGDVTLCYYIWSGEGGFFGLQGRDDTELLSVGAGFFARGLSTEDLSGLFAGIDQGITWPLGCCEDVYTSTTADALAGIPSGSTNLSTLGVEGGGLTAAIADLVKMYFKKVLFPRNAGISKDEFSRQTYRDGPGPGGNPVVDRTCIRRYEMYAQRTRVEVDPGDDTRVRIRFRLDGPGVEPPESGYWHFDEWCTLAEPLGCGALGLVSRQLTQSTWGRINGVRVFMSWAAKPLAICGPPPDIPEDEPPPFNPPVEGEPCTLILQVFAEDRKTLAWEVGTDPDHPSPYLALPEHYGEQEIDVAHGAASIGQVEVAVIDPSQIEGDQDSGFLTERLSEGGVTAIHGFRCRLLRFISQELGWVVIADGPATNPKMDESYAAYRWTIRDTRETERKKLAFVEATTSWLVPMGVPGGFWFWTDDDGDDNWLVEPQEPLTGEYVFEAVGENEPRGRVQLHDYWPDGVQESGPFRGVPNNQPQTIPEEIVVTDSVYDAMWSETELLGDPLPMFFTWPDIEILWRLSGSGDDWTVVEPEDYILEGENFAKPRGTNTEAIRRNLVTSFPGQELEDGTEVRGITNVRLRGALQEDEGFPEDGQTVDVAIRWRGEPTDFAPLHIEYNADGSRKTTGQLIKELYDGEYSPRDPLTGEVVPTGIRYDEEAVLAMDDPVYLRLTERVDDLRDWTENKLYAPTGWIPALDNDGKISPVSQVPPDPFVSALDIDDEITEPVPDWDAGERIVNILGFDYPRYYEIGLIDADNVDRLAERSVEHEFRDESSITKHGENSVDYDGIAFSAPGDELARTKLGIVLEPGFIHAQDRKLYVFDRFKNGAQIVQVPVMRSLHVHVPEEIEHHAAVLRAGDWVSLDLSWMPDYVTQRRGMETRGQVIAVNDVDCAWRVLLIEEVLPLPEES